MIVPLLYLVGIAVAEVVTAELVQWEGLSIHFAAVSAHSAQFSAAAGQHSDLSRPLALAP